MKSLSYLIHGVFCGRCGWRCECEILLALEQLGKDPLEMRSNLWSMLGILSLTWYISAKEEIEDESWLIWEEDSQLFFFFFVLNSKFCTFNEGVQFQQFFRRCRGWISCHFRVRWPSWNYHPWRRWNESSRYQTFIYGITMNKESLKKKINTSNVFITKLPSLVYKIFPLCTWADLC